MFGNFTEEARNILTNAKKEMKKLKHPYIGSEHMMLSILKNNNEVSNRLKEYGLDYECFKNELIKIVGIGKDESNLFIYTPLLKRIIENAIIDSKENNNGMVKIEHLFSSLLEEGEGVAIRIMLGMDIDLDELYTDFSYNLIHNKTKKRNKKLLIEELGIDLNKKAINNEIDPVVGRDKEIRRILEILSRRTKNNPILIGEPGVGKTAIVEQLSKMIVNGEVPIHLKNKRIISLDMATTVAGTKYRGEFEERVKKVLKEIEDNEDIILFIDEIHTLVGAGGAEGAIDASNIFKPALARGKLRCIGATTTTEYKKFIEQDGALERRFQTVYIEKPNKEMVKNILMNLKEIYESYHFVNISEEMIDVIIELSNKYIHDRNEPDRSIDLLDEVCAKVSIKENKIMKKYNELKRNYDNIIAKKSEAIIKNDFKSASKYKDEENLLMDEINRLELNMYKKTSKQVTKEDIAEVINIKTKIPVYEILNDNKKIINNLSKELHRKIIGQDKAIKELMNISLKIRLGFHDQKCYSMMFVGPTGVGKTMLAKVFGKNMTNHVIKLDMSEFSESHSVSKIIGSPPGYVGYNDFKNVLEEVRNNPYSVLILDEIEKAHPNIIGLFYQILDEGKIKNSSGVEVYFNNVIIIMTSNIGFTEKYVGFNKRNNQVITNKLKENFDSAFMNRIYNVIVFNSITEEDIISIIKIKLNQIKNKYQNKIEIIISDTIIDEIKELSEYKEFGARKIDKVIKDKIESKIIEGILDKKNKIDINSIKEESIV